MPPLLSIVIPTRNRQVYAASAIRTILGWDATDIELIVRDNSDSNVLAAMAAPFLGDSRLRFSQVEGLVPATVNFASAVRDASGEFVCSIGDDDILNPEIVDAVRYASIHGIDAIVTDRHRALYHWPDFRAIDTGDSEAATLRIYEFSGRMDMVDPEEELRKCAVTAGTSLQRLPKVYLGVVRRSCLRVAQDPSRDDSIGTCPDMYFAVAAASAARSAVVFDYPLIVPGASAPSTAGANRMKQHEGPLEMAPHFRGRPGYVWPPLVPAFYSVDTFYSESALAALHATGRDDLIRTFNFPFLYLLSLARYRAHRAETFSALRRFRDTPQTSRWRLSLSFLGSLVRVAGLLVRKRLSARSLRPGMTPLARTIRDLPDTKAGSDALTAYLKDGGFSLTRMIAARA